MNGSSEVIIEVEELGKKFQLGAIGASSLREQLGQQLSSLWRSEDRSTKSFWALRDINFQLKKGEVLGIIGKNGSGKSTLLKILSRITGPTEGTVTIEGKLSSLLEVGTGFHPELTGRENIFLNGSILGMTRKQIAEQFDDIVSFAGVVDFIDTPVKRYSSGMYVRLAFAVAAHLQPEILIVDEVLAVGDFDFQKKCLGKMNEVAHSGRSVIFVSHNMGAVAELCTRVIVLDKGKIQFDGPVDEGIRKYISNTRSAKGSFMLTDEEIGSDALKGNHIRRAWCEDLVGNQVAEIPLDHGFRIGLEYTMNETVGSNRAAIELYRDARPVFTSFSDDQEVVINKNGKGIIYFEIQPYFLKGGDYSAELYLSPPVFKSPQALNFTIQENSVNVFNKGYRRDRLGDVVAQGTWKTPQNLE